jgi:uncharacterized protein
MTTPAASPPSVLATWQPVRTDALRTTNRLRATAVMTAVAAASAAGLAWTAWSALALVAGLTAGAWLWGTAGRRAAAWSYAEGADDLLIKHGLFVRHEVVLPYARLQFADVASGPVSRRLGIATLRVYTASNSTRGQLQGLDAARAEELRDRLIRLTAENGGGT